MVGKFVSASFTGRKNCSLLKPKNTGDILRQRKRDLMGQRGISWDPYFLMRAVRWSRGLV